MAKARVTFADVNVTVTVPVGVGIIEISEAVGSYIAYNCREGDCGTCMFQVLQGEENLSVASDMEKKTLLFTFKEIVDGWRNIDDFDTFQQTINRENFANKVCRLACQTQVFGDVNVAPLS